MIIQDLSVSYCSDNLEQEYLGFVTYIRLLECQLSTNKSFSLLLHDFPWLRSDLASKVGFDIAPHTLISA